MKRKKTSSHDQSHPYMSTSFWLKLQPWENNPLLSESGKDYYRKWLSKLVSKEKNLVNLQQNLKLV